MTDGPTVATATQTPSPRRASDRRELIDVAMGRAPADVVIRGGRLVNVATAEIYGADVAVQGERIAAVGDVAHVRGDATREIDAADRYLVPGLVDGHLHMYHSYLGVPQFAQALLTHGVTATADGFYGQGIVGGVEAVRFFKQAFERMPIRLIFLVPTIAYLQNRELGLTPTPGIDSDSMFEMLGWPGCYGLEEPPFVPVVEKWPEFLELFEETLAQRKVITGHASGIEDRQAQAYAAMGCYTDHESVSVEDALRIVRSGMKLLMRQGSGCPDVPAVIRAFTEHGVDPRSLAFCVDVASPEKLLHDGGLDENVRVAIANGVAPITAIQMATLNVAEIFYAQQDIGVIAPGRLADILLVDDLVRFEIDRVLVGGRPMAERGALVSELPRVEYPDEFRGTVKLPKEVAGDDLRLRVDDVAGEVQARVVGITEGSLVSDERRASLPVADGEVLPSLEDDVLRLAMVDRHRKGTGIGVGFVQGFGLRRGAIASTVNAVCENIVMVGARVDDMAMAANALAAAGGGKVVVSDGEVLALVELPLLGLLAEQPLAEVMRDFELAFEQIRGLGCELRNPFSQLEFCFACGEIGDLKLSEEGLVDVGTQSRLPVIVE